MKCALSRIVEEENSPRVQYGVRQDKRGLNRFGHVRQCFVLCDAEDIDLRKERLAGTGD
jgi:hypothetical protein